MTPCRSELFISDLHLSPREPAVLERFQAFLSGPARAAARLTILGDLFDYWAGDDDLADPFNTTAVGQLRALADSGVTVDFMTGNRDFLVGADFAAATGMRLLPDPCVRVIAGHPTLLTHGDTLCTDDTDYLRFRAEVRAPAWRTNFLARPLAERKREIEALRARSEAEKQAKPMALMDVHPQAVIDALRTHGAHAIIHGHTHRQGTHLHEVDGLTCRRWVLGDWGEDRGAALVCDTAGCRFAA